MVSFLTMKTGNTFELHSHPEEQIMIVIDGYCDKVIEDKIYRVQKGDLIHLTANITHGAFIREVDCKVIDIFSPPMDDYKQKYFQQNAEKVTFSPPTKGEASGGFFGDFIRKPSFSLRLRGSLLLGQMSQ